MVQVFFHCSNTEGMLIDRYGAAVSNLTEARDRAAQIMAAMSRDKLRHSREWSGR